MLLFFCLSISEYLEVNLREKSAGPLRLIKEPQKNNLWILLSVPLFDITSNPLPFTFWPPVQPKPVVSSNLKQLYSSIISARRSFQPPIARPILNSAGTRTWGPDRSPSKSRRGLTSVIIIRSNPRCTTLSRYPSGSTGHTSSSSAFANLCILSTCVSPHAVYDFPLRVSGRKRKTSR